MSAKDRIEVYYDVNNDVLRDSDGNELRLSLFPKIAYSQQAVVNLQLVTDSSMTAYTELIGDEEYEASVDRDFDTSLMMCQTLNSGINQTGDWGTDTADPTQGQISIRLNALSSGFRYKMGTRATLQGTQLELLVKNNVGDILLVFRFPFRTLGILKSVPVASPATPDGNFQWFTDPVTGEQSLRIVNDDGEVLAVFTPPGV